MVDLSELMCECAGYAESLVRRANRTARPRRNRGARTATREPLLAPLAPCSQGDQLSKLRFRSSMVWKMIIARGPSRAQQGKKPFCRHMTPSFRTLLVVQSSMFLYIVPLPSAPTGCPIIRLFTTSNGLLTTDAINPVHSADTKTPLGVPGSTSFALISACLTVSYVDSSTAASTVAREIFGPAPRHKRDREWRCRRLAAHQSLSHGRALHLLGRPRQELADWRHRRRPHE